MKLNFKKIGKGKPLLILHGLFGSSDNWGSLGKKFAENNLVYLVDLRNHGRSPHSKEMSYDLMADDLLELIQDENINSPIILGHSMGGKAALLFAEKYPKYLEKLIVADIGIKAYPMHHDEILKGLNSVKLHEISSRNQAQQSIQSHIENLGIQQFLLKNLYWIEKGKLAWRMNLKVIEKNIGEILVKINVQKNSVSTLFVRGEMSNYILEDDFQNILESFPNGAIKTIPKVGHWLHAENPTEFYKIVREFINC
ncbi:MAG: alpha/beta fold hydrolase [Flavobacteriales bacterium]|tara:strand:+ start:705 stop:1466 length:762 start_codon:yes stop_codon:yes gene_type:complete